MKSTEENRSCSVLLAEDNKINQKLMVLMLGKLGVQPSIANNGIQAVEVALEKRFDLILMDMHMPGMDGLEATKQIRAALGDNSPSIVALTADVVQKSIHQALRNGIDAYLTKPISMDMLRECIEKYG